MTIFPEQSEPLQESQPNSPLAAQPPAAPKTIDALDRDLLISRVVDGLASDQDWAAMDTLAKGDIAVWRDLAQAQRYNTDLTNAVYAAVARSSGVEITRDRVENPNDLSPISIQRHAQSHFNSFARWTGWAAAAALAMAWLSGIRPSSTPPTGTGPNRAGVASIDTLFPTAADALDTYLRKGRDSGLIVGEVPNKVMLDAVPLDDNSGGYEVYYVRQIVERTRVPNLYTFTQGETGQYQAIPARITVPRKSGSY